MTALSWKWMNCKLVEREQLATQDVFRAASPQRGSWRQPAQGKCIFSCDDWSRLKICGNCELNFIMKLWYTILPGKMSFTIGQV